MNQGTDSVKSALIFFDNVSKSALIPMKVRSHINRQCLEAALSSIESMVESDRLWPTRTECVRINPPGGTDSLIMALAAECSVP